MMENSHKKVVYTALTGNYDRLLQPTVIMPDWDYICFTDRELPSHASEGAAPVQEGVWQLRSIPYEGGQIEKARHVKILPHLFLSEYEYSVWMDANLCISGAEFYEKIETAIKNNESLAMIKHPSRDCVYDELCVCYVTRRISWKQAYRHLSNLFCLPFLTGEMSMPRRAGLYETNVIFRRHLNPDIVALDETWWQFFALCSTRDQLTFTPSHYIAEKSQRTVRVAWLLGESSSARNVDYIQYSVHPSGKGPSQSSAAKFFRLMMEKILRLRMKLRLRQSKA